jgi:hypothetical protein
MQQFQRSLIRKKWHRIQFWTLAQKHGRVGTSLLPTKSGWRKTWHGARRKETALPTDTPLGQERIQDRILVLKGPRILSMAVYLTHDPVSSLDQWFNIRPALYSSGYKLCIFFLRLHCLPSTFAFYSLQFLPQSAFTFFWLVLWRSKLHSVEWWDKWTRSSGKN